ncbi:two-component sensor histidine kinase [Rhodobacter viridis]|uniref:histidine kinase n=1 Tax=Rhodobacter viridis TaxID=1054202 RepID=A0A318U612_9RHOB|nr:sensor histidine kinase [Rhodobacter viridis]PYF09910.1 two-component sensor histidine kinase [Rhodobacter viridis]
MIRWRFGTGGLGLRLTVIMGAVLTPLAVLSYAQTLATERAAENRLRAAILGETLMAAAPQVDLLMQARGTAMALAASLPQLSDDPAACSTYLRQVAEEAEQDYSFLGFVPVDGHISCASTGAPYDVRNSGWLSDLRENPRPKLTVNREGPLSGTSILNLSLPVTDAAGQLIGFSSVSMPQSEFQDRGLGQAGSVGQPLAIVTFDRSGTVLTATNGLDDAARTIPAHHALKDLAGERGESFLDTAPDGHERAFAVVPLWEGELYLLASWPADVLDEAGLLSGWPPFAFPALMWAASLAVAWIAAHSQVLHQIRALRSSITAFAEGERRLPPLRLRGAATELRDVAEAYERMTRAVVQDEADLENVIHQKEVLLREVHHRVKNNLQLIASILNMQLRRAKTDEARAAMRNVQERVLSLATIHRELYLTSGQTDIRADELLPRIAAHILKIGATPERRFDLDLRVDEIRLVPDQAVAVALFLAEGLDNALKHAWRGPRGIASVGVSFTRTAEGLAALRVTNTLAPPSDGTVTDLGPMLPIEDGFGEKLLAAFASQLDGSFTRGPEAGLYVLRLSFTPAALEAGEERHRRAET